MWVQLVFREIAGGRLHDYQESSALILKLIPIHHSPSSSLTPHPPSLGFSYVFWFLAIKTIWLIGQAFLGRDSGDASIWFKNRVISRLRAGII